MFYEIEKWVCTFLENKYTINVAEKYLNGEKRSGIAAGAFLYSGTVGIPNVRKAKIEEISSALIPDCRCGKPWFWFGMREDGQACTFSENEYTINIADKYFKMGEKRRGFRRSNFFYYTVTDIQNCRIGDTVVYRKNPLFICEKVAEFVRGQIVFTYKIGPKSLIGQHEYYNEQFTGLSLEGTVVKTDHEIVHIHLDIDGERSGTTYPYAWKPISGNLMYSMPKLGTRASLFMPDHDERNARAADSPRVNGGTCPDMGDYNNRYLTTEHYKRMYWFPDVMGLVGTGSESTPLQIAMSDENGMLYESHLKTEIIAHDCLKIEAPNVSFHVPLEMHMLRTSSVSAQQDSKLIPIGTGFNSPAPSGDSIQPYAPVPYDDVYNGTPASPVDIVEAVSQTCLALQNMFPSMSQVTVYYGWEFCAFSPFDDAPKEGEPLDVWKVIGHCVVGAIACAVFIAGAGFFLSALAVAATATAVTAAVAGASACVAGAIAAGIYTADTTIKDVKRGKATSTLEFLAMLTVNSTSSAASAYLAFYTPGGFIAHTMAAAGIDTLTDGIQHMFDNASQEFSRTGEFGAKYNSKGDRYTDFELADRFATNLAMETIFGLFGMGLEKVADSRALKKLGSMSSAEQLSYRNLILNDNDLNITSNSKTLESLQDVLLDSCTTDQQFREMKQMIDSMPWGSLQELDTKQLERLITAHPEIFADSNVATKMYGAGGLVATNLPGALGQFSTDGLMEDAIADARGTNAKNREELQKLMEYNDDMMERLDNIRESYQMREELDNFDINFPFGKQAFLSGAINAWVVEE